MNSFPSAFICLYRSLLLIALLLGLSVSLTIGQAFPDEDFTVYDYIILEESVGLNDVLPAGQRVYTALNEPVFGTFNWVNTATGEFTYYAEPIIFQTYEIAYDTIHYQVCVGNVCYQTYIAFFLRFQDNRPVAYDDVLYVETGTGRWGRVDLNDFDPDDLSDSNQNASTYEILDIPVSPMYNANPTDSFPKRNGFFYYEAPAGFIGTDEFSYFMQDPFPCDLFSDAATVTIYVVPNNLDPSAQNASIANAAEETPVSLNLIPFTSDPENEVLSFHIVTPPAGGVASLSAEGLLTYTGTNNFIGQDILYYAVTDLVGQMDTAQVVIQVANANNDAPLLINSTATTPEDQILSLSVSVPDAVDGDVLTYAGVTTSSLGTFSVNSSGVITYSPAPNFTGTDVIRYRACDSGGLCDTAQVIITITPVNDAPLANNDSNTTVLNGVLNASLANNDTDIDSPAASLTYSLLSGPNHGTVVINTNGTYTYTPDQLYFGFDTLTYRLCDGSAACDDAILIIEILYVNLPPQTEAFTITAPEDQPTLIPLQSVSVDLNGGDLNYQIIGNSPYGSFTNLVNQGLQFNPATNYFGTFSTDFRVCDTGNLCDTASITIEITPVNDPPQVQQSSLLVDEDASVLWAPQYSDVDDSAITMSIVQNPQHGLIDNNLVYSPQADFNGSDTFTFEVCDALNACVTAQVNITVAPVNDAPLAGDDAFLIVEDQSASLMLATNDSDTDGDLLSYALVPGQQQHTLSLNALGELTILPSANFFGEFTLLYAVCDGDACDTASVVLQVTPVNDLPNTNYPVTEMHEDTGATFDPATFAVDIENDNITFEVIASQQIDVVVDPVTGIFELQAPANYFGQASFTLQTCDGPQSCVSDVIQINILPVNDAPVINEVHEFTFIDIAISGELQPSIEDIDDQLLTVEVNNGLHGALNIGEGLNFTYVPESGYVGVDSIYITVCDDDNMCGGAWFIVDVFPPNQPPVALSESFAICQAAQLSIPLAQLVSDDAELAQNLNYTFTTASAAQLFFTTPAEQLTVVPSTLFSGVLIIDMIVCDNAVPALCDSAYYTVEVTPTFTPQITQAQVNHVSCFGNQNGSITLEAGADPLLTTFLWSNGESGSTISQLQPGDYQVTILTQTPCSTPGNALFHINEPAQMQAAYTASNINDQGNGSITLDITGGTPPYSAQWTGPDGFNAQVLDLENISTQGTYAATITDNNDCQTQVEVVITSTNEELGQADILVYPNPVTDGNLYIALGQNCAQPCGYRVIDISGKEICSGNIYHSLSRIELAGLSAGYYVLKITSPTIHFSKHIIKHNN